MTDWVKNKTFFRFISVVLSLVLLLDCLTIVSLAQDEEQIYDGNTLGGWTVGAFWNREGDPYNIDLTLNSDHIENVTLTVSYYAPVTVMTRDFGPGEVKFHIPDIGAVRRGTPFKPLTATGDVDSEWELDYDIENGYYIFSNKRTFYADEALSGGFTMAWQLKPRECQREYNLEAKPIFELYNDETQKFDKTRMDQLSFRCKTIRDYYNITLSIQYEIQSGDPGKGGGQGDIFCKGRSI